jgi:hypothetical protein
MEQKTAAKRLSVADGDLYDVSMTDNIRLIREHWDSLHMAQQQMPVLHRAGENYGMFKEFIFSFSENK